MNAESSDFVGDTFLPIIRSLSYLEVLEILSRFRLDGAILEEIALCYPRLTFLEFPLARVDISLTTLCSTSPLPLLKSLQLHAI